ncbi:dihydrodipicolinate synthase family protein [Amycolatopsis sp. RTGN1]|uniref:dihydrodipicolinate synthase family protein n=1 Tax=Amycolatopsis ponsaeliensis TaxID=2992142 RepID=UPI00254B68E5|nr:dihydrodipicolinate synthase family protein [Amycolatopsis sp. RTGN1]
MPRAEVLSATPTLFRDDGALDEAGNTALLTWLSGRVDGVFVAGTTGEFPALDRVERRTLVALAMAVFGPDRTIVHVGAASTREAVALTADALAEGATRLAVLTPYYLPADAQAVGRHFAAVRDAAGDADVYGYLFPDRTGVTLSPEQFAATGLRGGKLSGAAAARFADFRAALPDARFWSGADTDLAAVARAGGAGIVSGLSSAFPEPFTDLAAAVEAGDTAAERAAQARADAVLAALGGTVEGIKEALRQRGIGTGLMRMPAPEPAVERISRLIGD